MDENNNNITYDENWQSVSETEYPVIASSNPEDETSDYNIPKEKKTKRNPPSQLLVTIQLILYIIIALAAFLLKNMGGTFYSTAHDWYYSNLNSSAIFDGNSDFDLNSLFNKATADEV